MIEIPAATEPRPDRTLPALDGIRAISVILVLGSHAGWPVLSEAGGLGVDIFFVLSGYLITTILLREHATAKRISLTEFYKRRALRLSPALGLTCGLFLVYAMVALPDRGDRLREAAEAMGYITNWTRAFELNHAQYLAHTWSLGIEEQFYLLWPIVLIVLLRVVPIRSIVWVVVTLVCVSAAWRMTLAYEGASVARLYNGFDTRCDVVLAGCAVAFVAHRLRRLGWVGFAGLVGIVTANWAQVALPLTTTYTADAVFAAMLIAGALDPGTRLAKCLSIPPLPAIGRISYGLYLFHFPVFICLGRYFPNHGLSFVAAAFGLTAALAITSYLTIERPCLRARRQPLSPLVTRVLSFLTPLSFAAGAVYLGFLLG